MFRVLSFVKSLLYSMEISRFGLVAGSVQEFSPDGGCGGGQLEEFRQVLLISKVHPDRFHLSYEEVHRRQDFVANISDQVSTSSGASAQISNDLT